MTLPTTLKDLLSGVLFCAGFFTLQHLVTCFGG